MIGLFALYIILNMRSHAKLLDLLDELAFPSDDPIMTSSLKEPVFEYEEEEPEEGESEEDASEEAVELTPEEPEVFDYEEPADEELLKEMAVMSDEEWAEMEARAKKYPVPKDSPPWPGREIGQPEAEIFTEGLEPKEESELRKTAVAASILYEVGNYTESGEATLRQIKGMRKDDVIGICEIHGLDTEGTKAQLIERIKENAA